MKILFSHRNFPAQFRHILIELAKDSNNEIVFITGTYNDLAIKGVKKYIYNLKRKVPENCHRYLKSYEESVNHGLSAAEIAISLKNNGFIPDVIYAHPWGNSLFFKDIYPNVPIINFCEWYYNSIGANIGFNNKTVTYDTKAMTRCKNAQLLIDLVTCDIGIAPTHWQKQQYPKEFQNKIQVIHDGIDTDYFMPDSDAILKLPQSNIKLTSNDEVVTYATRGMEPYRGFPEFMRMAEKLLQKRPNTQIVIAGEDRVCYGVPPKEGSYKKMMLNELNLDLSRVHFTGALPYGEYKKLLQISSAHIYLTYPFVLSWSMLEAMSTGCCVIASKTPPVEEIITNNFNGYLVDFYNIPEIIKKVEYALDNKTEIKNIKNNARKTILNNYDLKKLLPKHINLIKQIAQKNISISDTWQF